MSLGTVVQVLLLDGSAGGSMATRMMESGIDVETRRVRAVGVVAGGGDIESAKDHGGQLAEMQTVLEMARQCLKWAARAMGLEDAY